MLDSFEMYKEGRAGARKRLKCIGEGGEDPRLEDKACHWGRFKQAVRTFRGQFKHALKIFGGQFRQAAGIFGVC